MRGVRPLMPADLAGTVLGRGVSDAALAALAARASREQLAAGDVLYRRGDAGDALHLVLSGRLAACVTSPGGAVDELGDIGAGEVFGGTALLAGAPRSFDVIAREETDLARLDRAGWESLAAESPELAARVVREAQWRARAADVRRFRPVAAWCRAWLARTELFHAASPAAIDALERRVRWDTIPADETLVDEQTLAEALWLVVRGRLRITHRLPDGTHQHLGDVGAGECVGDLAVVSGVRRPTTVTAVRDTELLRLDRAAFEEVARAHPDVALAIAHAVIARLPGGHRAAGFHVRRLDKVIAVIARDAAVPFAAIAAPLVAAMADHVHVVVQRAEGPSSPDAGASLPDATVMLADGSHAEWTRHCLRQADEIVVVAGAADDPALSAFDRHVAAVAARRDAAARLVLVHDPRRRSHDTAAWLAGRRVAHVHVRLDAPADIRRAARLLAGCATGLALSGGGARGFAHIGVLRALAEAGIDVDIVTGTSMGAQVGALLALGLSAEEIHGRCREWVAARPWTDYTLPFASVVRGRRLRRAITQLFGAHRLEDLWVPFACVTSNLTRASCDVHTAGPLALLVAASNAVPGLAPPVRYADDLHVDGGVLDNLPVAAARALGAGRVIAVDVSSAARFDLPPRASLDPSGWALAWDHLRGRPQRLPPVHASLTRALTLASDRQARAARREADVVLHLPLAGYASSDFASLDRIVELGYNEATRRLTEQMEPS